ncbi:MAG: electron transfer flavoprotein subunit beta/FixA family protein, partial [Thermoanaerobaculaceae bacterium]|nr:electron transfer flavoprotein subunit beta/FixA family protein [Thermoanaerobaculaceae bacterium]
MRIFCLIKHVRDTETRIKVVEEGKKIEFIGDNKIISPYDEFAVEEGLKLKEKFGGEVVALTVGDEDATKSLRQAMAMGADSSILVNDPQFYNLDPLSTAKVIAKALEKEQFDLILAGKHGVGDDNQAVPSMVAAILGIPVATVAVALEIENNTAKVKREIEGGLEVVSLSLPAVITCQKGLNEPRYPSLKGIMAAKKKEVKILTNKELSLESPTFNKGIS